mmetsp:Transcript_12883/g.38891  ORF Transcript_12883/g.38891 Transcript_12883/m.38891 type:complete len:203 (-) Transcript_12883:38-646(-)|eukprot:CAMPEP_0185168118 /NCGR_PEP_ID=MMETSP1139-20130426/15368_1 /TAXON_ID=298111 /ORGANISM="Pavlova sp., Strain CCMP459" /LENGTH=202 /DNA_ID=CAMNT_0027733619 /DNA_START=361 /DNA_END=969 /DNA_ORIENTATION=+
MRHTPGLFAVLDAAQIAERKFEACKSRPHEALEVCVVAEGVEQGLARMRNGYDVAGVEAMLPPGHGHGAVAHRGVVVPHHLQIVAHTRCVCGLVDPPEEGPREGNAERAVQLVCALHWAEGKVLVAHEQVVDARRGPRARRDAGLELAPFAIVKQALVTEELGNVVRVLGRRPLGELHKGRELLPRVEKRSGVTHEVHHQHA